MLWWCVYSQSGHIPFHDLSELIKISQIESVIRQGVDGELSRESTTILANDVGLFWFG